jgi:hypothetical protein
MQPSSESQPNPIRGVRGRREHSVHTHALRLSVTITALGCAGLMACSEAPTSLEASSSVAAASTLAALAKYVAGSGADVSAGAGGASGEENANAADDSDYVYIPGTGQKSHKSCVHEAPPGSTVRRNDDGSVDITDTNGNQMKYGRCGKPSVPARSQKTNSGGEVPAVSGWIMYSSASAVPWNNGRNWYNGIQGTITVPIAPKSNGAVMFLFNDLQNSTGRLEILQPVVTWGNQGSYGGHFFTVANWWAWYDSTIAAWQGVHSTAVQVASGTQVNTLIGGGGCTTGGVCSWLVLSNPGYGLSVSTSGSNPERDAYGRAEQGVLEVYPENSAFPVTSCDQLTPIGTTFSNMNLYQPPATGDVNTMVEMYNRVSWSSSVTPGVTPSCPVGIGYAVNNITRGSQFYF